MKPKMLDQPKIKLTLKKNDQVLVVAGDERGKKGKVLKVFPEEYRAIVEGVNFIKKAQRPNQRSQKGGIIEKEAPVQISNLKVICRHCQKPTRLGRSRLESGQRIRVCKKCGEIIEK